VVRREYPNAADPDERVMYEIHEAYYDDDDRCYAITEEPTPIMACSMTDLIETLGRYIRAAEKPVLDYETRQEIPR
jgi:hypothetical protein